MSNIIHSVETHKYYDTTNIEKILERRNKLSSKELAAFMIKHNARRELPYGIWTCSDKSEVVFNREYQPMFCRKDGVNVYDDNNRWVNNIVNVVYLYNDSTSPMDFLTKHLGQSSKQTKECKKSLLICIDVLRKYTPEEHGSVNKSHSIVQI